MTPRRGSLLFAPRRTPARWQRVAGDYYSSGLGSLGSMEIDYRPEVRALYLKLLGHAPDEPSLEIYARELASGVRTVEELAAQIMLSEEYRSKHMDFQAAKDVVRELFQTLLGHPPTESELNGYASEVMNYGVDVVRGNIMRLPEYVARAAGMAATTTTTPPGTTTAPPGTTTAEDGAGVPKWLIVGGILAGLWLLSD